MDSCEEHIKDNPGHVAVVTCDENGILSWFCNCGEADSEYESP